MLYTVWTSSKLTRSPLKAAGGALQIDVGGDGSGDRKTNKREEKKKKERETSSRRGVIVGGGRGSVERKIKQLARTRTEGFLIRAPTRTHTRAARNSEFTYGTHEDAGGRF